MNIDKCDIAIQKADYKDLPAILAIQKSAFLEEAKFYDDYQIPPLTQSFDEIEKDYQDHLFLKAMYQGQIVGSVKLREQNSSCWLGRLIVSPEFQNRGIGRKLLTEAEAQITTAKELILFTGSQSTRNINLYESVGYKKIEEYADENNPDLILIKMIKSIPEQ